jgi:hypothetical protein
MNATELADDMEGGRFNDINYNKKKAADFVRQQQAEIEALKKEAALQRLSDFTQEAESFDRTASHMAGEYMSYKPELTDEEWNKAFDCYCETDEGVLKFDFELRDEWKREQLIRWKEALRKAQEK